MFGCRTILMIWSSLFLKRLSWSTRLMAASSPLGESLVWKTTPKEPLPTILHWVYCISFVSPVKPSWTFSRITSPIRKLENAEGLFCDMIANDSVMQSELKQGHQGVGGR